MEQNNIPNSKSTEFLKNINKKSSVPFINLPKHKKFTPPKLNLNLNEPYIPDISENDEKNVKNKTLNRPNSLKAIILKDFPDFNPPNTPVKAPFCPVNWDSVIIEDE